MKITLKDLIQFRDALTAAKPIVDQHGTVEDYMAVVRARSLANAWVELLSNEVKVEVKQ